MSMFQHIFSPSNLKSLDELQPLSLILVRARWLPSPHIPQGFTQFR